MAKKVEAPEEVVEPVGYSSADLMAEIPRQVFNGEKLETVAPEPEKEAGEEEGRPPESMADALPPEEEGEEKPPETEAKVPPEEEIPEGWKFKPKYKDHQAAEEGAQEHQRKVTEATEQAKTDREAREAAERERDDLRRQLAEKEAAKAPDKPPEEVKKVTKEEREGRVKAASKAFYKKIRTLDQFDPEHDETVENAFAEALLEAGLGSSEDAKLSQQELDQIVSQKVQEQLQATREAERAAKVQETEAETNARVWKEATGLALKAGLDITADPDVEDLFRKIAQKIPPEMIEAKKPLKEQVEWAVAEFRRRTNSAMQVTDAEREIARKAQEANAVLERGSSRPGPKKEEQTEGPYTTAGLLREVQEERRIRA